jgi:mono/diheme cytochrome c family protein
MIKPIRLSRALALVIAIPGVSMAQDAETGREIAEEYCVRCHDIEDGGAMKTYPPSFDSVSVFRSEEQIRARILFPALHTSMPQWGTFLDLDDVGAVTAYILSLE